MSAHDHVDEASGGLQTSDRRALFWACFTAIAATAAVFAVRGQVVGDWAREFALTETQKGELLGVERITVHVELVVAAVRDQPVAEHPAQRMVRACQSLPPSSLSSPARASSLRRTRRSRR